MNTYHYICNVHRPNGQHVVVNGNLTSNQLIAQTGHDSYESFLELLDKWNEQSKNMTKNAPNPINSYFYEPAES